jgi:predicted peptidase
MRAGLALFALFALIGACAHGRFPPDASHGFVRVDGASSYFVYLPKAWSPSRSWPVIVYLHGGAERGDDPARPTQVGLGPAIYRTHGAFPFVVLFPQAPAGTYWGMPDNNARVLAALDDALTRYHGDPDRVILTGNSLGGFGTWFLGALHPERFAALVPICGGVRGRAPSAEAPFARVPDDQRPREIARRIGRTPVWIFHGAADWLVPVRFSREMAEELKRAGADVRYTEYPGVGHPSWERAYAEPGLFDWMAQARRTPR